MAYEGYNALLLIARQARRRIKNHSHLSMNSFKKLTPVLRWLLALYIGAIVIVGLLAVVIAGYGVAHGAIQSNLMIFAVIFIGVAIAAIPPFALLSNSRSKWKLGFKSLAAVVTAVTVSAALYLGFFIYIEPQIMRERLSDLARAVRIDRVIEEPVLHDGMPVGMRLTMQVRLSHKTALDAHGAAFLESLEAVPEVRFDGASASFLSAIGSPVVTFGAIPIDQAVAGLRDFRAQTLRESYAGDSLMPIGVYQVSQVYLFSGLKARGFEPLTGFGDLCKTTAAYRRSISQLTPEAFAQLENNEQVAFGRATDRFLNVNMVGRFSFGVSRGHSSLDYSAPLRYRYNHANWTDTLHSLPIEACRAVRMPG